MSQLIACHTSECLLLAADRRVVTRGNNEVQVHIAQKLFPLGENAAVATSGAAVGIETSRELARSVAHRAPASVEALDAYALHVFNQRYEAFKLQGKAWFEAHPEAHRLSYILLGGTTGEASAQDRSFRFFASEGHDQPYGRIQTAEVLTAPRRIGLETRLAHAARTDATPQVLRNLIIAGMQLIEDKEHTVSGPFDIAQFDHRGRNFYSVDSL